MRYLERVGAVTMNVPYGRRSAAKVSDFIRTLRILDVQTLGTDLFP